MIPLQVDVSVYCLGPIITTGVNHEAVIRMDVSTAHEHSYLTQLSLLYLALSAAW